MNIENLSPNMIIKNYKELCNILDIKPMTSSNSKMSQFKELERYCTYSKQGQKIIIGELFDVPLDKIDLRQEGNNSKYVEHVKTLLLHELSKCEGHRYALTKDKLLELLGMVNPLYLQKEINKKTLPQKDNRIKQFDINHFYLRANNKLTRILFDSLNNLKRRFLIDYREVNIIVKLDEDGLEYHSEATVDEVALINSIKYSVLMEMNLNSMMQVIFKFKTDEFYKRVNTILKDKHNIEYTFKQIELIFTKHDVLNELSLLESKQHKQELNTKVINTINLNAKDTYNKNIKEYNESLNDFLLNDTPCMGDMIKSQFKRFQHKSDYLDIQLELAEYLLRTD